MKPIDLLRRHAATQATLARFKGKPFDWRRGIHCAALLRFHLKKMGHPVPPLPPLRSALAARRELDRRGCADLAALCGGELKLEPIAPAAMLMGDVAVLDSAEEGAGNIGALFVCAGPHKVFGWREDMPRLVMLDVGFDQLGQAFRV
jgi:hypothetical protein